jgi:uncharacterized protein YutD
MNYTIEKNITENNEYDIIINLYDENINEFIDRSDELIEKINFIKNTLKNNKLRKNFSNNSNKIIKNINKTIEIIDETVINNCLIQNI